MRVENKRTYRGPGVYIGRPSKWGNPYVLRVPNERQLVIDMFEGYARDKLKHDPTWLDDLRGAEVLVCWCAPLPCHGYVLARMIGELDKPLTP